TDGAARSMRRRKLLGRRPAPPGRLPCRPAADRGRLPGDSPGFTHRATFLTRLCMTANGAPTPAPAAGDASRDAPRPGARTALILLLAINLFNYIDRQVLAAVLPKIKVAFLRDDPLAQTKLGLLTTAFILSYMLLAPVFGWLGDRMSRWLLV